MADPNPSQTGGNQDGSNPYQFDPQKNQWFDPKTGMYFDDKTGQWYHPGGTTPPPPPPPATGAKPPATGDAKATAVAQSDDPNARTGQLGKRDKHIFVIPPHPNTQFDEENFLTLLEGSISLTMEEKKRVIEAIPRLKIEQINELISIFEEEKQKFAELEKEFASDVEKLKKEREKEMNVAEIKQEEESEADAEAAEAEALRKRLKGE